MKLQSKPSLALALAGGLFVSPISCYKSDPVKTELQTAKKSISELLQKIEELDARDGRDTINETEFEIQLQKELDKISTNCILPRPANILWS